MENASKALLIAGAILLVIAIIGIGMAIFGQAQNVLDDTTKQLDALAVQAHNSQFDAYMDKIVKGRNIKELCAKIANYNQTVDAEFVVTISMSDGTELVTSAGLATGEAGEGETAATNLSTAITANKNYLVTGDMNPTTGLYTTIVVTAK